MSIDNADQLAALKRIGRIVAQVRDAMVDMVEPGVSTGDLDSLAGRMFRDAGVRSAPQLAYKFPGFTCISVNDALAHGIPAANLVLREGDLVNVDVSAELEGYWADTGASAAVGRVSSRHRTLLEATWRAREEGLAAARAGARIHEIGRAVEKRARRHGLQVIRNIGGHGVGGYIHEEPHVNNHYDPNDRMMLHEGLVLAIEPFLCTGASRVVEDGDGWTLRTPDGSRGAQYEHTVVVTKGAPIVITQAA